MSAERNLGAMRAIDMFLRVLTVVIVVGVFLFPDPIPALLGIMGFLAVGVYAVIFPSGILGWAKTAHPRIDVMDESFWWVPRLIGVGFILISVLIAATTLQK